MLRFSVLQENSPNFPMSIMLGFRSVHGAELIQETWISVFELLSSLWDQKTCFSTTTGRIFIKICSNFRRNWERGKYCNFGLKWNGFPLQIGFIGSGKTTFDWDLTEGHWRFSIIFQRRGKNKVGRAVQVLGARVSKQVSWKEISETSIGEKIFPSSPNVIFSK